MLAVIEANEAFAALEAPPLREMRGGKIETLSEDESQELVKELARQFGSVEGGASDVKKALDKARKALRAKTPDREKALEEFDKAVAAFEEQLVWRAQAEALKPGGVEAYMDGIRGTLGVRLQERFTREQALAMASCASYHRDISLNF